MVPFRPHAAVPRAPAPAGQVGWTGTEVRLRRVGDNDRRTLVRFDRESARRRFLRVDGYRHWAAHRAAPSRTGDDLHFAIERRCDSTLVGSMCTTQTELASGRFSYGIGIGQEHQRCGYALDAIRVLLSHMFGARHYRKCEVGIYACNHASLALHDKLGFREDIRAHDPEEHPELVQHLVLMSITRSEFAAYPGS